MPDLRIVKKSSFYKSPPLGVRAQPHYYNLVIAIHTSLNPHQLLFQCQTVEHKLGRVKKQRWGSRTIDIDLLLYGDKTLNTRQLIIPHPEMLKRSFVLVPLIEVSLTK